MPDGNRSHSLYYCSIILPAVDLIGGMRGPKPWGGDSEIATHPDVEARFFNNPMQDVGFSLNEGCYSPSQGRHPADLPFPAGGRYQAWKTGRR